MSGAPGSARVRTALGLLAALLALAGAGAPAARAAVPQGVYEGCAPGGASPGLDGCIAALAQLRRSGFRLVLNYSAWYGSQDEILAYAQAAQREHIKLIWPLNHPAWRDEADLPTTYARLHCGCVGNDAFRAFAVGFTSRLPATWGYYVGDELPPAELPAAQRLASQVRWLDRAHHPLLYVSAEAPTTDAQRLQPFASLADVAGSDTYPIVDRGSSPRDVSSVARAVQRVATRTGRSSALVLQSFSWSQYPGPGRPQAIWPTAQQMRQMRDLALRNARPRFVLWYSLQDIRRSDDPAGRYAALAWAALGGPWP